MKGPLVAEIRKEIFSLDKGDECGFAQWDNPRRSVSVDDEVYTPNDTKILAVCG